MKKFVLVASLLSVFALSACEQKAVEQTEAETQTPEVAAEPAPTTEAAPQMADTQDMPAQEGTAPVDADMADSLEYLYKSDNGENITVTFFDQDGKRYAKVVRDDQPEATLEQTTAWAKGAVYENDDYTLETQSNDATLKQGDSTMQLTVISPLQYVYQNDNESIMVAYFDKADKRLVSIQQDNQPELILEQTTAWAKGAEYGNDTVQWHSEGDKGTLIKDGNKIQFTQMQ